MSLEEKKRLRQQDSLALKIAVMPTLDCLPLYLAKEERLFDTLGVDVRLRLFNAQMDCDTAIIGGSVEGLVSDLIRTENIKRKGISLDYLSSTNAYWQLIANKKARVHKISQLGDKMIAMARYSVTDYLTRKVLSEVKMPAEAFSIQVNDVNIRLSMLVNNEMDAMWLTEPQATAARELGNPVLYDSKDTRNNFGVIAFRSKLVEDKRRKQQIEAFAKAYNMACDSLNKNGLPHYSRLVVKYCNVKERVAKALPKLTFNHIKHPLQKDIDLAKRQAQ